MYGQPPPDPRRAARGARLILDGTLPECDEEHTKPLSNRSVITDFLRTLPESWQEEWIATQTTPDFLTEVLARGELDRFTELALRRIWSQIDHGSTPSERVPSDYLRFAEYLPPDLKALALVTDGRG